MDEKEKKFLLGIARRSVGHYLKTGQKMRINPQEVPSKRLAENGASFVTLYLDRMLRGCIGSLEATRPLVFDVAENALHAAFGDPRFYPLTESELLAVKFSISVLTKPVPFQVKDHEDLLERLEPRRHGMIIKKGYARSTFLPAVWEHIPEKEEFLAQLCMKAGLEPHEWKDTKRMEFYTYETDEFSE